MNPETFAAACEEVRAAAGPAFASLHGFSLVEPRGFYPRVRAERDEPWSVSVDFWMCFGDDGKYRSEWNSRAPFELGGAASITREEAGELVRYWKRGALYERRPYVEAIQTLSVDLVALVSCLDAWTEADVLNGERTVLPSVSRYR